MAIVALLCALLFFSANTLKSYMQAAAVFFELDTQKVPLVLAPIARHPGEITDISIPVAGEGPLRAMVYAPTDIEHPPAIVLLHGVHYLGYTEPRLVAFASALTRCGFQVLTPDLPELQDYRITPNTITQMKASILYFSQKTGQPVSVMGLSFAGGLALMAAADPAVQPHVRAVLSVGGHDSFARVAAYYITGHAQGANGKMFAEAPHDYGPLVLAYNYLSDYVPAADVAAVGDVLKAHLYENASGEALLTARLTPRQAAEWRMLEGGDPAKEHALAEASNTKHAAQMEAVSPEGHLAALHTQVFLLHGAEDNVIPPTELSWLEHDVPADDLRGTLVTPMISHVSLGKMKPTLADYWRGLRFLARFLHTASA